MHSNEGTDRMTANFIKSHLGKVMTTFGLIFEFHISLVGRNPE